MKDKKAQAALEFLMTYGWAILVVLVVIGALAYFGVLNPSILLPEKCTMQLGVSCLDHRIDAATDQINFKLRNGMGRDIAILNISAKGDAVQGNCQTGIGNYFGLSSEAGCGTAGCGSCTGFPGPTPPEIPADAYYGCNPHFVAGFIDVTVYNQKPIILFQQGETIDVTLNCTLPVLQASGKTKVAITMLWYGAGSSELYTHTMQGELLASIEGG